MSDKFSKFYTDLDSPAERAFPITPSDTPLALATRGVYVGGEGNLVVSLVGDANTVVTFSSVNAGALLPFRISTVYANTTCNNIVGIV
jgi:hypothetical protein